MGPRKVTKIMFAGLSAAPGPVSTPNTRCRCLSAGWLWYGSPGGQLGWFLMIFREAAQIHYLSRPKPQNDGLDPGAAQLRVPAGVSQAVALRPLARALVSSRGSHAGGRSVSTVAYLCAYSQACTLPQGLFSGFPLVPVPGCPPPRRASSTREEETPTASVSRDRSCSVCENGVQGPLAGMPGGRWTHRAGTAQPAPHG